MQIVVPELVVVGDGIYQHTIHVEYNSELFHLSIIAHFFATTSWVDYDGSMAKIPTNAKRVFKGVIFDVYQWPQKMFDGSVETFEMLKRPDSLVVIAVDEQQKVIMINEDQPDHSKGIGMPAGRHDKAGEDIWAGAKRELAEETGYTSDNWKLIHSYSPQPKIEWTVHYFLALDCQKTSDQQLDNGEKISVKLVGLDEFLDHTIKPGMKMWNLEPMFLRAKLDPDKWLALKDFLQGKRDKLPTGLV